MQQIGKKAAPAAFFITDVNYGKLHYILYHTTPPPLPTNKY